MATVDFYYGLGSRYSYLAASRIAGISTRTGATFRWRPLFSGEMMRRLGRSPFEGAPISGQYDWDYRQTDAGRWAAFYGIPFIEPARFALAPSRYAIAAEAARHWNRTEAFSLALFEAIFATGTPVGNAEIAAAAAKSGLDPAAHSARTDAPEVAAAVDAAVDEALRAGVFGVPTFVVDGDFYWGNDRLPILEHRLLQGKQK